MSNANLSDDVLRLIGEYGSACRNSRNEVEITHCWQQLVNGIKAKVDAALVQEPQPDADGWIEWHGGECPIPGAWVDVKFRGGHKCNRGRASAFYWGCSGFGHDIIAYRVTEQIPASPPAGTITASHHQRAVAEAAQEAKREPLTDAARDVLAERRRQVEAEGWTPEHDDEHAASEMALAAACYAMAAGGYAKGQTPPIWPWSLAWWKPTYGRRDLVKAGALILAEIERIDRAHGIGQQESE